MQTVYRNGQTVTYYNTPAHSSDCYECNEQRRVINQVTTYNSPGSTYSRPGSNIIYRDTTTNG